jgi:tripartite-type tricarboxylate transporter receptor subunit TctC
VKSSWCVSVLPPLTLLLSGAENSCAQTYPVKTVRIIVGFAAGGGSDIIARVIAQKLTAAWGQTVIVDNRVGASGIIGAELVAKAPADGYTLLVSSQTSTAVAASLYSKLPYDVLKDFSIVTVLGSAPTLVMVHPSLPPRTFREFVSFAKANFHTLSYGTAGIGSTAHLAGELMNQSLQIRMTPVPYKGESASIADVISGQLPLTFATLPAALPQAKGGKLRGLAITSLHRSALAPEFPTAAESGVPGYEVTAWNAVYAPAALPPALIARLNADIVKVLGLPDVRERLAQLGIDRVGNSPDEAAAYLRTETARWGKVIKSAHMRAD